MYDPVKNEDRPLETSQPSGSRLSRSPVQRRHNGNGSMDWSPSAVQPAGHDSRSQSANRSAMSIHALLSGPVETPASSPAPEDTSAQQRDSLSPPPPSPPPAPPVSKRVKVVRKKPSLSDKSLGTDAPPAAKKARTNGSTRIVLTTSTRRDSHDDEHPPNVDKAQDNDNDNDNEAASILASIGQTNGKKAHASTSTPARRSKPNRNKLNIFGADRSIFENLGVEDNDGPAPNRSLRDMLERKHVRRVSMLCSIDDKLDMRRRATIAADLIHMFNKRARKGKRALDHATKFDAHHKASEEVIMLRERRDREQEEKRQQMIQAELARRRAMAPPVIVPKSDNKRRRIKEKEPVPEVVDDAVETASVTSHATVEVAALPEPPKVDPLEALHDQIWQQIARKEVPKVYRIIQTNQKVRTDNLKKTIQLCSKEARRWQVRTNKSAKDTQMRAKRSMREVLTFWKRNERGEKLDRQKAEREIIDRAKREEEERESRRQSRKLNFLITQTELYSHFVGRKIKTDEAERTEDTAGDERMQASATEHQVPVEVEPLKPGEAGAPIDFDADDDEALRRAAARNAQDAIDRARDKAEGFDAESGARQQANNDDPDAMDLDFQNPSMEGASEVKQPGLLSCMLKEYQLKGLNWLVNLYEQGINGILADEMGLGKTVQSISVMAHLAERYNIWGPFLVIAPASTLHNWQQEITRFVPRLKPLPYWGSMKDRKVLRKFWDRKRATYTEDAPFHVVITSYQLVVQDSQYFKNVRWQYMILDEAQAIKSSQSSRWKNLLAFKCRNRLLLTGTPIQNTMQELWALLHFIMPTLFDSHDEFSEWFSKDIENHAQRNSELNSAQLRRLHMILKPFMLRRVKKNVQKELGDKIELDVFCDLNIRQREIYSVLRREISMKDIIEKAASGGEGDLSSLMNLVMQLRKVCNHPDLFERADVRSPLDMVDWPRTGSMLKVGPQVDLSYAATATLKLNLPKFVYRHAMLGASAATSSDGLRTKLLRTTFDVYAPSETKAAITESGGFSAARLCNLSLHEIAECQRNPLAAWDIAQTERQRITHSQELYEGAEDKHFSLVLPPRHTTRPGGPLHELFNVGQQYCRSKYLHYMNPMYDPRASAPIVDVLCPDSTFARQHHDRLFPAGLRRLLDGPSIPEESDIIARNRPVDIVEVNRALMPKVDQERRGYNSIRIPSMETFIADSGKLAKLDQLLVELKRDDHRVLLYFQMTRMIDLMEEYLVYRQYKYLRLDGSSKISDRRDMVTDWQTRPEMFVFLLSTRAGGLGINLTAADTVIFYDSDWNPTIDSQAMDRAHRLGQTRQVTVYRLITRGTIEERILHRAKQKEEVQKVVISGGDYKQGTGSVDFQQQKTASREVVSWLLNDEETAQAERIAAKHADKDKDKSGKGRAGKGDSSKTAQPKIIAMDDLYHEGEGTMTPDDQGIASLPDSPRPNTADKVAGKKKSTSKKKKTAA